MDRKELAALFEGEHLVLAFDTNAIYGNRDSDPFVRLCNTVNNINEKRSPARHISLVISAPVYVEKLHDMRQAFKGAFDFDMVRGFMESKGIQIEPFAGEDAETLAELLGTRYPSANDWRTFKRARCFRCLNLPEHLHDQAAGSGKNCGATLDWLVAGHAHARSYVLITDDRGPEFKSVSRRAKLKAVCDVADQLLEALTDEESPTS